MKQLKMTFPDCPALSYFLNMFNHSQYTPGYLFTMEGPATSNLTVTVLFTDQTKEPDLDAIHKMFAAASSLDFVVMDIPLTLEPQTGIIANVEAR